jgi:outer membrane protein insertion porin family
MLVPESELRVNDAEAGESFNREKLNESTKAISDRLGRDGYALPTSMGSNLNRDKSTAELRSYRSGRRVYVRRINVVGNNRRGMR